MPAIVRCPNGCKLQVPVRKLFDSFQCPKCSASIFIDHSQVDEFEKNRKHVLKANLSSDLVEIVSDDIIFLEGEATNLLIEVTDENEQESSPTPPPVVDQTPSDAVFAAEKESFLVPTTPTLEPSEDVESVAGNRPEPNVEKVSSSPALQDLNDSPSIQPVSLTTENEQAKPESVREPAGLAENRGELSATTHTQKENNLLDRWFSPAENPGIEHRAQNRWKAYSLGWAMVVIGIFLLGPVVYTMMQWIGKDYHLPLGRWSFLLIFFSAIQFLYALFLFQLPDWSATRFVSYFMLLMTVMSSFMLAVAFLSQESNNLFNFLQLSVTNKTAVCGWLTIMSIGFGLMSYLCGRTTQLWMSEEKRLGVRF